MMILRTTALALGVLAFGLVQSRANSYIDLDEINVTLNKDNTSYSGKFNIVTGDPGDPGDVSGFDPATEIITYADAWFTVAAGTSETTKLKIGLGNKDNWVPATEITSFEALGGEITGNLLVNLGKDGIISYEVQRTRGNFELIGAALGVETTTRQTVPDGGSALGLFSAGLACLFGFGRKFRRS